MLFFAKPQLLHGSLPLCCSSQQADACVVHVLQLVFGGAGMHGTLGDIWIFNTGDRTWITPVAEGKPPCPREMHTGTMITDGRMLVFGGRSPAGQVMSLFNSPTWPWMIQLSDSLTMHLLRMPCVLAA